MWGPTQSLCLVVWVCRLLFYFLPLPYRLQGGTRIYAPTQPMCLAVWVCQLLF